MGELLRGVGAVACRAPLESPTTGVGSRETAWRRFIPPCAACPGPAASEADGVGSREPIAVGSWPACPPPRQSRAAGVGKAGEEEDALSLMRRTDVRRAKSAPLRIEPEAGKVSEDGVESKGKVPCDVLKDRVSGS
ncbi:hypothetical protein [Streptomyces sp. WAC06614]|uniref:hypothetical protein n=1 Tax=Streptomyces sp. WAC06614 TaxID=2487416 RepID=UPI0021AF6DD6|nr:hypothetical protein [Streptomyces sp. WAC06614]